MSYSEITPMRKKLDGHDASAGEFAKRVTKLLLGDPSKGIEPLGIMEIVRKLGFKSKQSVIDLKKLAIKLGYLELDSTGKPILPTKSEMALFKKFTENNPFANDEYVASWLRDLMTRADGAPLQSWKALTVRFQAICNTLKTTPEQWVSGNNTVEVLEQGRNFMKTFMELYKDRKAEIRYFSNWTLATTNIESVRYGYAKAARDFMGFHNYRYPDGEKGIMAQSITRFHGNFSDVKLSDEELAKCDKWLKERYPIDSDIYRIFWFGIESMARNKAIWKATTNYSKHVSKKTGKTTYIMEVFESKTKHIRGGKITKFIKKAELQESIDKVIERGGSYIVEERISSQAFTKKFGKILKEMYKFLGKEKTHLANPDDSNSGYFMNHAFHVMRHIGAHSHLRKTKYHYGYVAEIGGWNKVDELKDSYGKMPPEMILDLMDEEDSLNGGKTF